MFLPRARKRCAMQRLIATQHFLVASTSRKATFLHRIPNPWFKTNGTHNPHSPSTCGRHPVLPDLR
ncbi:hypothetical protein KXX30_004525 [Aspergillus fumigatus]|nr:hypothetical protein KXX30_004525 [Aspergillus fumigatus]KAH1372573.1 hypothetical protein KXX50_003730 [Aspergillus fumigatus]KAH1714621.1 hypothetical protein KXX60_003948 [Aspergillus fumigatus]KAH2446305.1 hypothetical protein KXV83_000938 [Aspergillus fumigatus]KAH2726991.1 hypothetical protein KXV39_006011 [Aspergillus fumigatus]